MTKELSARDHLIIGGLARGIAITALYPLDTIKTRIQNASNNRNKRALYSGYTIAISTQVPYGMLVFGMYENIKSYSYYAFPSVSSTHKHISSAIASDFLGTLILCPAEIVKQNMQIGRYKNVMDACRSIYYFEGFRGFYKGYSGLLMRDLPFRAIQLPLYDSLKQMNDGSLISSCASGALAGMVAGCLTCPMDVVKTRLMLGQNNLPIMTMVRYLYITEGFRAFYRGLTYRTLFLGYSSAVFFVIYESIRKIIAK